MFSEQSINEAVITIPSYFNQAERRAMTRAAELAGLRLLQLINDNTAGTNFTFEALTSTTRQRPLALYRLSTVGRAR